MDPRNYDDYGGVQHVEYCFQVYIYIYDLHFHVLEIAYGNFVISGESDIWYSVLEENYILQVF